jgi:hypothetical protein
MTDRLSRTNALADANIDRQKAERIATEIFNAIHDNVATKADIDQLETALGGRIATVETALGGPHSHGEDCSWRSHRRCRERIESGDARA